MTLLHDCKLCHPERGVVERGEYWTLVLNENQALLGRCYFALNRHETDVTSITFAEQFTLFEGLKRMKQALDSLFSPDHYNYVSLNNVSPHVHAHIIPRYASWREFDGKRFTDGRLGGHYDPAAELFLSASADNELTERIKAVLPQPEPIGIERSEIVGEAVKRGQREP